MAKATTTINLTPAELQAIIDTAVASALKASQAPAQKPAKTVSNSVKAEVKKAPKAEPKKAQKPDVVGKRYGYRVIADTDTRDNSKLWVVKVVDSLSREEYMKEQASMKTLGGYYSRFKGGFIFRYDPSGALKSGKAPKGAVRAEYTTKKGAKRV
jgi:hypothetical protein